MNNDTEASDLEDEGPTPPCNSGAGLLQSPLSTVYELCLQFETQECVVCSAANRNVLLLDLQHACQHWRDAHKKLKLKIVCTVCGKSYQTQQGAAVHKGKCSGPKEKVVLPFVCSECNRDFSTQRGLSTHERSAHPEVRNRKRAAACTSKGKKRLQAEPAVKSGSSVDFRPFVKLGRLKSFSVDEIMRMLELEVELQGCENIASLMIRRFPGKTLKQIRDKRNTDSYKDLRTKYFSFISHGVGEESVNVDATLVSSDVAVVRSSVGSSLGCCSSAEVSVGIRSELPPTLVNHDVLENVLESSFQQPVIVVTPVEDVGYGRETPIILRHAWGMRFLREVCDHERVSLRGVSSDQVAALDIVRRSFVVLSDPLETNEQTFIDYIYGNVLALVPPRVKRHSHKTRRSGVWRPPTSRSLKRTNYAQTQNLFERDPKLLAKCVREGLPVGDLPETQLDEAVLKDHLRNVWEVSGPRVGALETVPPRLSQPESIKMTDVNASFTRMNKDTAAGPDGLIKSDFSSPIVREALRIFFNLLVLVGCVPSAWRTSRTSMIPKAGKDPKDPGNYRPITIAPILSRLFFGILLRKFSSYDAFSSRQKGFVSEFGCFNNIQIFNECLTIGKAGAGLTAVTVDVTKAFDSVPHNVICNALRSKGLPEQLVALVVDSYRSASTVVPQAGGAAISLLRGVKQGDPVAPYIFNAVVEPLLIQLEERSAFNMEGTYLSVLGFADDLVLLSNTPAEAQVLLRLTESYFASLSMGLAPRKCSAFEIVPGNKTWFCQDPLLLTLSGLSVPYVEPTKSFKYLGISIDPWSGIQLHGVKEQLEDILLGLGNMALKAHQRIELLTKYIVPHFQYRLIVSWPSATILAELDQLVRKAVKQWLHLPRSINDHILHVPPSRGGVGIPRLEHVIPLAVLKSSLKLLVSSDPVLRNLRSNSSFMKKVSGVAASVRLNWRQDISLQDLQRHKNLLQRQELRDWKSLACQGKGVESFSERKEGNLWLVNKSLLKPARLSTAIKMRANVAANRVSLNNAVKQDSVLCRKCKAMPETLGHILGLCVYTKAQRISRHNQIRDFICDKLECTEGFIVAKEPTVSLSNRIRLKPDLVVKSREGVFVVDVTVRHEDGNGLWVGRQDKLLKYNCLLPVLGRKFGVGECEVLPIVVGTRGTIPKATIEALEILNIKSKGDLMTISLMSLRSSIEVYHTFMDYDR